MLLGAALLACAFALVHPTDVHAGYPLASEGRVVLGFGATYRATDATTSSTHRGVDIAAEAEARVFAPLAGTVTFAGRVPTVGGGTAEAVTISTGCGSITLLPLSDVSVAKGDLLAEGDVIGVVASTGDGSSVGTHLHVGLKRADLYVDPMPVLALPVAVPKDPGGSAVSAGQTQGSASAAEGEAGVSAVAGGKAAGAPAGASAQGASGTDAVGGRVGASLPSTSLRPAIAGTHLAPGVSVGGLAPQPSPTSAALAAERALAPLRAAGLVPAHAQATAQAVGSALDTLFARAREQTGRAVRAAGIVTATVLGGIGLLWPLWRREEREGSGEDRVSAISDDVAGIGDRASGNCHRFVRRCRSLFAWVRIISHCNHGAIVLRGTVAVRTILLSRVRTVIV